jgi:hypothetical protein
VAAREHEVCEALDPRLQARSQPTDTRARVLMRACLCARVRLRVRLRARWSE